jgi:putative ABC transport system permease protein
MLILMKHIIRNIRGNKFRSALIILSLAVATMILFLNLTIQDDLMAKYTSVLRGAYQEYDLRISLDKASNEQYFKSEDVNLNDIDMNKTTEFTASYGIFKAKDKNITVLLYGSNREELMNSSLFTLKEKSKDYDSNADDQIVISSKTAKSYDFALGDKVKVLTKTGEREVRITGIAAVSGLFLSEQDNILFITTLDLAGKAGDVEGLTSNIWIDIPDNVNAKDTVKIINDNNPGFLCAELVDQDSIKASLKSINQLLMIVLVAVIALNFYVISSITKLILATRIPVVGTFRSVGATKRKMNFILFLENVVYGVIGGGLGIVGGILLRNPLSSLFIYAGDAFEYVNVELKLKPAFLILPLGFAIGLQILVTLSGILKVSRRSIKDIIFNTLRTTARISKKKTILGILLIAAAFILDVTNTHFSFLMSGLACIFIIIGGVFLVPLCTYYIAQGLSFLFGILFGAPAALGAKNTANNKTIRSSIILITVAISLIITIFVTTKSLNKLFTNADEIYTNQVDINHLEGPEENYLFLNELDYIDHIDFAYYSYINGKLNEKESTFFVVSNSNMMGITSKDEELAKTLTNNQVMIDEFYASSQKIKVGDTITIKNDDFKNKEITLKVVGFVNSYMFTSSRNVMIVTKDTIVNNINPIPSTIEVYTSDNPDDVKQKLKEELAGSSTNIQTRKEFRDHR